MREQRHGADSQVLDRLEATVGRSCRHSRRALRLVDELGSIVVVDAMLAFPVSSVSMQEDTQRTQTSYSATSRVSAVSPCPDPTASSPRISKHRPQMRYVLGHCFADRAWSSATSVVQGISYATAIEEGHIGLVGVPIAGSRHVWSRW